MAFTRFFIVVRYMGVRMNRRQFSCLLGGVALAWPHRLVAQQSTARIAHVGYLIFLGLSQSAQNIAAFKQGLLENGLVEGKNIDVSYVSAEGSMERARELAVDLGSRNLDVIVTAGTRVVQALLATGTKAPIVFAISSDPIGNGLVES